MYQERVNRNAVVLFVNLCRELLIQAGTCRLSPLPSKPYHSMTQRNEVPMTAVQRLAVHNKTKNQKN